VIAHAAQVTLLISWIQTVGMPHHRLRIWGLGSPHGDDRVGWEVVRRLGADPRLRDVARAAASPWDLLDTLESGCRVIVVDASQSGRSPGSFARLGKDEAARCTSPVRSGHAGSLAEVMRLAEVLGYSIDEWVVLAVEIESCEPGTDLGNRVRQAVEPVVGEIQRLIRQWEPSRA
jgi:hydrogenase maturation protease